MFKDESVFFSHAQKVMFFWYKIGEKKNTHHNYDSPNPSCYVDVLIIKNTCGWNSFSWCCYELLCIHTYNSLCKCWL